jgi:DNA-binding response OmpR family regulator
MKSATSLEIQSLSHVSRQCQANPEARILLVDDNPKIGQSNSKALLQRGYEVDVAEDGETGWAKLQNSRYNLLIIKNDLPELTGVRLLKKLRSACMPLPVIMVIETMPTWESPEYSWLLNANKLLMPYSFDELLGMVKRILHTAANIPVQLPSPPNWQRELADVRLRS